MPRSSEREARTCLGLRHYPAEEMPQECFVRPMPELYHAIEPRGVETQSPPDEPTRLGNHAELRGIELALSVARIQDTGGEPSGSS